MWISFMNLLQRLESSEMWRAWILVCPFIWMLMCIRLERERRALAAQREQLQKCQKSMEAAVMQIAGVGPSLEELRDNDEKVRKIHTQGHVDCPACEAVRYQTCFSEGEDEYYRRIRQWRSRPKGDDDASK